MAFVRATRSNTAVANPNPRTKKQSCCEGFQRDIEFENDFLPGNPLVMDLEA